MRQQPLYRRILSQGGTFLANLVLGTRLKDMTSGFEGFQRKVLENMNLDGFCLRAICIRRKCGFIAGSFERLRFPFIMWERLPV